MNNKVHLTEDGLQQIINIRASMNWGLSDLQKFKFPHYNQVARPIISYPKILNPNWFAGFVSGDGCFFVSIFKSNKNKIGHAVQLIFKLTQHKRDKELLGLIAKYLNCGAVYYHSKNAFVFKVTKFADMIKIIRSNSINQK
jgi:hypothetical protein